MSFPAVQIFKINSIYLCLCSILLFSRGLPKNGRRVAFGCKIMTVGYLEVENLSTTEDRSAFGNRVSTFIMIFCFSRVGFSPFRLANEVSYLVIVQHK